MGRKEALSPCMAPVPQRWPPAPGQCQAAEATASRSGWARCCQTGLQEMARAAGAWPWVDAHRRHSGLGSRQWPSLGISARTPM